MLTAGLVLIMLLSAVGAVLAGALWWVSRP